MGQKNLLLRIAKGISLLTSKQNIIELHMSGSSILSALGGLEEKNIIEKKENRYQIINPIIKHYSSIG